MVSNGVLPLDDDDRPALGLWDAAGHQIVAAQAGTVSTDSTTGVKYAAPSITIANGNANGQSTMANSSPVVIASDQSAVKTKGDYLEIAGQGTGVVNATNTDLIPSTDVSGYKYMALQIVGTWSGTLAWHVSNDNVNWSSFDMTSSVPTNTEFSVQTTVNGFFVGPVPGRYLRVRMIVYTSNTSLGATLGLYTVAPSPMNTMAWCTQQGAWTVNNQTATTGGSGDYHLISAASTNLGTIKASAGQVYGYEIYNSNAAARYVKLYNKASAPTVGTDVPYRTIGIAPNSSKSFHSSTGLLMGTGISIATTTGIADTDTTAVGASDLSIDIDYK